MNLLIFLIGLAICILSHPKVLRPLMTRLFNEGIVSPKQVSAESAEVIKFAGPNISLFLIGIIIMLISFII